MRIQCPACAAAYDVPDALLQPGRPVRCVRCNALWQPDLPVPAEGAASGGIPEAAPAEAQPAATHGPSLAERAGAEAAAPAVARPSAGSSMAGSTVVSAPPLLPGRPPAMSEEHALAEEGSRMAPAFAWVVSLLILGAALGGLVVYRREVMAVWPPAARLFSALGLS